MMDGMFVTGIRINELGGIKDTVIDLLDGEARTLIVTEHNGSGKTCLLSAMRTALIATLENGGETVGLELSFDNVEAVKAGYSSGNYMLEVYR